jgi:hypothetical protein
MQWSRKWVSQRQPGQQQKARPQFDQFGSTSSPAHLLENAVAFLAAFRR